MPYIMAKVMAFLNGIREFRSDFTTHYEDFNLLESYDIGRELAHRLTFRKYDNCY